MPTDMKITTLNFDDVIRAVHRDLRNEGKLKTGNKVKMFWNQRDFNVLRRFGVRDGSFYLGSQHFMRKGQRGVSHELTSLNI